MSAALHAAVELLVAAVRHGVRDIVVCPGSRSQALALVAAELERVGAVQLHVRIDERSAGFFALGIARESRRPVPVITTSGTAVANLHPAMLEAYHAGVPLVALTADRPAELVGTGANQTTLQPGIFGPLLPTTAEPAPGDDDESRARAAALGRRVATTRIPWHLNLAYREPLSGPVPDLSGRVRDAAADAAADVAAGEAAGPEPAGDVADAAAGVAGDAAGLEPLELDPVDWPFSIVIAGDGAGAEAERVARQGGWPLVAEISSGARFGRNLLVAYRELLGPSSPVPGLRDRLEFAIVFGHPTLSREVAALLQRPGLRVVCVAQPGVPRFAPRADAEHVAAVRVAAFGAGRLTGRVDLAELRHESEQALADWCDASRRLVAAADSDAPAPDVAASRSDDPRERARFGREELAVAREPVTRALLVDAVWRHTWPHDRLVLGASRLIRDLDARATGKRVRVHANRGLAGIDGTIATALGVAYASQHGDDPAAYAGTTRLLLGDLAFAHDASSLLVGQGGEDAPRLQILVGNDGGGTIFSKLEVAETADAAAFERVMRTPRELDVAALATAYGWEYRRAETRAQLEAALSDLAAPRVVIEVPLPAR